MTPSIADRIRSITVLIADWIVSSTDIKVLVIVSATDVRLSIALLTNSVSWARTRASVSVEMLALAEAEEITAVGGAPRPSKPLEAAIKPPEAPAPATGRDSDTVEFSDRATESQPSGAQAPAMRELAARALPDALLANIVTSTAAALRAAERPPSLTGDLRMVPISAVLQLLDAQQQSGTLGLRRDNQHLQIFFRKGRIDLAVAVGPDADLGVLPGHHVERRPRA